MKSRHLLSCAVALSLVALLSERTFAEPPYLPAPGVFPYTGSGIPGPESVPGKEYTPLGDMSNPPIGGRAPLPGNILQWDGFGGAIDIPAVVPAVPGGSGQVDALANHADVLFHEVVGNSAALLI